MFYTLQHLGGRTPSYGYMTPSHDPSRTPSHGGSAWDPSSAATPARSTDDFDYTGSYDTPSPAGVSILYNYMSLDVLILASNFCFSIPDSHT